MNKTQVWNAVITALRNAFNDLSQTEPQLVANLVWHITQEANKILGAQASGVFVHGSPHVTCNNFPDHTRLSVEIGDLLLLRSERGASGSLESRRALLLQAKKVAKIPTRPDNKNQHHLYATWPKFTYKRHMDGLTDVERQLTGTDLSNASQYLLLTTDTASFGGMAAIYRKYYGISPYCHSLTAHATYPELSHHRCFAETLFAFILGDAGKAYENPPPNLDIGWSRVIEDLVTVTGKRASAYIKRASTGAIDSRMCFMAGIELKDAYLQSKVLGGLGVADLARPVYSDGPPEIPEQNVHHEDNEGSISIVEFIVTPDNG